jgi:hypothetical protein
MNGVLIHFGVRRLDAALQHGGLTPLFWFARMVSQKKAHFLVSLMRRQAAVL